MTHFSYTETAERLAKSGWGRDFSDTDAADKSLAHDMDLTGACLLSLMNLLDRVIKSAYEEQHERKKQSIKEEVRKQFRIDISSREAKHGPIPDIVYTALWRAAIIEMALDHWHSYSHVNYTEVLPQKGTKARSEYDKWMKRKAKNDTD